MRVINQGGYLHENISRIWLEEDCIFIGRRKVFHTICGQDEDKGYSFVLDWGIDREQVRDIFGKMQEHLRSGSTNIWNCPCSGLIKEKEERV